MQTSKSLLARILPPFVLLTTLLITACAPVQQADIVEPPRPVAAARSCPAPLLNDEGADIVTPEEFQEELAGLRQLGSWKSGKPREGDVFVLDGAGPNGVPLVLNPQVEYYIAFFQGRFRCHFTKWLSRSTIYLPTIQQHFAQKGLPPELAALALIESGFSPMALSSAKAAGLWQFIEGTGKRFGLRVDRHIDERRNADKASRAAASYLRTLYDEFGHWYLAVAAYNAGEGKIRKAIDRYGTRDFWELADQPYLALETKRYVPQLIAAILIMNDPARYGFGDNDFQYPEPLDSIDLPGGTSLTAVSMLAGCSVDELRYLNRELLGASLPPGPQQHAIRLPRGTATMVAQNLPRLQRRVDTEFVTHTVQSGQKIGDICNRYNISTTTLLKANNLQQASLKPGQRLRIPQTIERYVLADAPGKATVARSTGGQSLAAESSSPLPRMVQADRRKTKPQQPQNTAAVARPDNTSSPAAPRVTAQKEEKKTPVKAAAAPAKSQHYVVQRGDNLWKIAKKFQVSADDLRRWNKLASSELKPGEKIRIREV